ncbi:hypothetical protein [Candidatus Phytoplasma solani]|nr:hypothetical protein [Candidatus Phytoplasma solani]CCP88164.1 conserved hypothetical protein [Candidatus Phytoplasma solani]
MSLVRPQVDATLLDPNQVSEVLQIRRDALTRLNSVSPFWWVQSQKHPLVLQASSPKYDKEVDIVKEFVNGEMWLYVYDYETGKLIAIYRNVITEEFTDSKGNVWLYIYDAKTGKFIDKYIIKYSKKTVNVKYFQDYKNLIKGVKQ